MEKMELIDDNYCFACGTDNPSGLKLVFSDDGIELSGVFTPAREHQGYRNVVHGGIISTLIDEAMARLLINRGHSIVTVRMEVRYRKPVPVGEPVTVKAREQQGQGKFLKACASLHSASGMMLASGEGTFAVI